MAKKRIGSTKIDQFSNVFKTTFGTAIADTIQSTPWTTGYRLKDGYGFVVHQVEWTPHREADGLNLINAEGDYMSFGITTRNDLNITDLVNGTHDSVLTREIIGLHEIEVGALANARHSWFYRLPIVRDFTNEPGGGRIIAPNPLYFTVVSNGLGATINIDVAVYYTMISLDEKIYRELYESMNPSA